MLNLVFNCQVLKMNNKTFCLMVDCSRNAVINIPTLKKLIRVLHQCGYNALMLYTEDTYEVNGEPYFGHLRGRYTKEEIKDIVNYAEQYNIEVIPCIQVLAHLNQMFCWPIYLDVHDYGDVLLVNEKKTYDLIEKMIKSISECFKSKKIHLGMDEAAALGLGNSKHLNGDLSKKELFSIHLNKVLGICDKYHLEPLMWSDMLFKLAMPKEENFWYSLDNNISKEDLKNIPQNVTPIYWDYYHEDINSYRGMIDKHFEINKDTWFAGGIWTWTGFVPANEYALKVSKPAMEACREKHIDNIIITAWGDDGAECSLFSILPTLYAAKRFYDGEENLETIKKEFKEIFDLDFDDFMSLGDINNTVKTKRVDIHNPSKYLLYNDPLTGILDYKVSLGDDDYFAIIAKKFTAIAERLKDYGYIANHLSKLASVLEIKNSLGVRLRNAYKNNDKETLKQLIEKMDILLIRIDAFIDAFRTSWYIEKKTFGFDVEEIRLGGLRQRVKEARLRIEEYLSNKIDIIEELEQDVLPFIYNDNSDEPTCFNQYIAIASPNKL